MHSFFELYGLIANVCPKQIRQKPYESSYLSRLSPCDVHSQRKSAVIRQRSRRAVAAVVSARATSTLTLSASSILGIAEGAEIRTARSVGTRFFGRCKKQYTRRLKSQLRSVLCSVSNIKIHSTTNNFGSSYIAGNTIAVYIENVATRAKGALSRSHSLCRSEHRCIRVKSYQKVNDC